MSDVFRPNATVPASFLYPRLALQVQSPALTRDMWLVTCALAAHVGADGRCWPSRKRLTEFTKLGFQAVDTTLSALQSFGIITRQRRRRTSVVYHIHAEALAAHVPEDERTFSVRTEMLGQMAEVAAKVETASDVAVWLAGGRRRHGKAMIVGDLAEVAGCDIRTARRSLRRLEERGIVTLQRPANGARTGMLVELTPDTSRDHGGTATPDKTAADPGQKAARPRTPAERNSIRTHSELSARENGPRPALAADRAKGLRTEASGRGRHPSPMAVPVDAGQTKLRTGRVGSAAPNPGRASGSQAPLLGREDIRTDPVASTLLDRAVANFWLALIHVDLDTPHAARAAGKVQSLERAAVDALTHAPAAEARAREPDILELIGCAERLNHKIQPPSTPTREACHAFA